MRDEAHGAHNADLISWGGGGETGRRRSGGVLVAAPSRRDDRGVYLLVVRVVKTRRLEVAALGEIRLRPRYYLYVGSALQNLRARIARHHRRTKKLHWHIDFLSQSVDPAHITGIPIPCTQHLECRLARDLSRLADSVIPGFGCSDCRCASHLLFFPEDPLHREDFLKLLLHYLHRKARGERKYSERPSRSVRAFRSRANLSAPYE